MDFSNVLLDSIFSEFLTANPARNPGVGRMNPVIVEFEVALARKGFVTSVALVRRDQILVGRMLVRDELLAGRALKAALRAIDGRLAVRGRFHVQFQFRSGEKSPAK